MGENKSGLTLDVLPLQERRESVTLASGFHDLQIVSYGEQIERDQTHTLHVCPVCFCLPRAPVVVSSATISSCPHTFCSRCVAQLIKHSIRSFNPLRETVFGVGVAVWTKCPVCRHNSISVRTIHRWKDWQPRLKAAWEKIQVRCVWPGCDKVDGAMKISAHEMNCTHRWSEAASSTADGGQTEPATKKQALEQKQS